MCVCERDREGGRRSKNVPERERVVKRRPVDSMDSGWSSKRIPSGSRSEKERVGRNGQSRAVLYRLCLTETDVFSTVALYGCVCLVRKLRVFHAKFVPKMIHALDTTIDK